ncbi:MAG: DUF6958 family protein [Candidatus Dormibacteraceae bacterium]
MTQETVLTKHPLGKTNQPIDKHHYETFKAAILSALRRRELTHTKLLNEVTKSLKGKFSGNIGWHVMVVKLDLEARKLIERTASSSQKYRLK